MAKKISASDVFAEEDIFLGIRQSAEKTILTFQEIDAEVKKMGANLKKELSGADFGNTKGINEFVSATQKANQAKEESIKIDKILAQATKDMAAADKALIEIEIKKQKLTQEQLRTNQQIAKSEEAKAKAAEKASQASKVQMDSYKSLAASTRDLKNQSKELGAQMLSLEKSGQKGTAAYAQLEQQFREVTAAAQAGDAELKAIDKTVGDNFRNVGNYEGATKGLKQQLREMTQALQNMETTDPRFKQMSIDAGNLKDQINDTNAVIKSTAGSAVENLGSGIAKAGKVGIDAFAGMTGAMGLFGVESESAMQAMLKLQQLAAVSEALSSLGALGDTMTEIKASFVAAATKLGLFTAAKEVDIVVTETQIVATEGATVATNTLGKAMKAVPIIAIIAGIVALVAAIASYVSSSDEASRSIKYRKEQEEKALKASREMNKAVAQESSEFVGLIAQLQSTNAHSKERTDLITKINNQYGTTLKNLSDETAFQAALNLAIEDYIAFQTAKYKMQKNDKLIQQNLQTQADLNSVLATQKMEMEAAEAKLNKVQSQTLSLQKAMNMSVQQRTMWEKDHKNAVDAATRAYEDARNQYGLTNASLSAAKGRLMSYGAANVQLTSQIQGKYVPALQNATTATQKATESKKLYNDETERSIELGARDLINVERTIAVLEASEQRKIDLKDIAVLEAEITLEKANQAGSLKDIAAAEKALTEAKKQAITAQMEYDLKNESDPAKQELIKKQAELDILQLYNKKIEDSEKNHQKKMEEMVKMAADYFIKNSENKISQIDKEISAAEKQYDTLKTLAENGNINAQESLAEQQRIINEANARKEKELKRQQRIKLAESVYSTYSAKVAAGSEHPILDTIKDTMLLQQFIASLPTFFDGTEDTGKNGNGIDGKGGFHAILHPNERVVPKSLNDQIGSMSNEALAKMANEYRNGKIMRSNSQMGSALETALLINKIDELTEAVKMKPETNIGIGEITQSVLEIVHSTKQGNTTTYNRYKVRK